MSFQRAFSSLGCPEASLADVIALAKRHQLAAVELRALGGSVDLLAYLKQTFGTPAALAEKLRGEPVRIAALDTSGKLVGATDADKAALLAFVSWAEALRVPYLRVFDGGKNWTEAEFSEAAALMQWWRELRQKKGWKVDLMIETHDALFTAAAINRFVTLAPGSAILWDTHHTWKRGGEDPLVTWAAIQPHVVHVHVKDSVSRPSARHPFTYVLPGEGEFPAKPILAKLKDEFDGIVSLEWEKQWHPYLGPMDDALNAMSARAWW